MTATASKSPGTMADDATIGTVAWTNPDNAKVSDNIYSTAVITSSQTTHYLKATNFNLNVPSYATIKGIVVSYEFKADVAWTLDYVRIVKAGIIGVTNKTLSNSTTSDLYVQAGSSSDLWGESWTPTDINNSNFGVVMSTVTNPATHTISVDHITITVYYSIPERLPGWYYSIPIGSHSAYFKNTVKHT